MRGSPAPPFMGADPARNRAAEEASMADNDAKTGERDGAIARTWRRLTSPSARWSVLALVVVGLVIGAGGVVATQLMVAATGTNDFCGGACHSMQWVAKEYTSSAHASNRTGVR